jgi:hypothetical protein
MVKASPDWSRVPPREWEWMVNATTHGVHTYEGQLVWWERPAGPGGYALEMASEQTFDDFLASGPPISSVHKEIVDELRALLVTGE